MTLTIRTKSTDGTLSLTCRRISSFRARHARSLTRIWLVLPWIAKKASRYSISAVGAFSTYAVFSTCVSLFVFWAVDSIAAGYEKVKEKSHSIFL